MGPRGIQKLVDQRRREGVLLPFRVSIMRHSRLALVTQWEDDYELTEEVLVNVTALFDFRFDILRSQTSFYLSNFMLFCAHS